MEYSNPTPVAVHLQAAMHAGGDELGLVIIRRADNGQWALPGGYIENGLDKSAEEAAAREFQEETGIVACSGKLMHSTVTPTGRILIFSASKDWMQLQLGFWLPTPEALEIRIAVTPLELCYPAHTEAMQKWFDNVGPFLDFNAFGFVDAN